MPELMKCCSRHGCENQEREPNEFRACPRCKAAFYCSRGCQTADFCSTAHTTCALGFLAECTAQGPWDVAKCKKAVRLLQNNLDTDNLVPILAAVQATLHRHERASPMVCLLLGGPFVGALLAALTHLGPPPSLPLPDPPPPQLKTYTAIMATIFAFCDGRTKFLFLGDDVGERGWREVILALQLEESFDSWLQFAKQLEGSPSPTSGSLPFGAIFSFLTGIATKAGALPLHVIDDLAPEDLAAEADKLLTTHLKVYDAVAKQPKPLLHHVAALAPRLSQLLTITRGALASALVARARRPDDDTLPQLLWPLHTLVELPTYTADGKVQPWTQAAVSIHMAAMADVCQWVASREGLVGLKVLAAAGMAEAVAEVLETWIRVMIGDSGLSPAEAMSPWTVGPLLEPLQTSALKAMAHLAATSEGRACLAQGARLWGSLMFSQWLHPAVKQQLAVLAYSAITDWVAPKKEVTYWCPLYSPDGGDAVQRRLWPGSKEDAVGNAEPEPQCQALEEQLASCEARVTLGELAGSLPKGRSKKFAAAVLQHVQKLHALSGQVDEAPGEASAGAESRGGGRRAPAGERLIDLQVLQPGSGHVVPLGGVYEEGVFEDKGSTFRPMYDKKKKKKPQAPPVVGVTGASLLGAGQPGGPAAAATGGTSAERGDLGAPAELEEHLARAAAIGEQPQAAARQQGGAAGLAVGVDPGAAGGARAPGSQDGGSGGGAVRWQCAACGARASRLQLCSGCLEVRYCGPHCQREHWKQHKAACKAAQAARRQSVFNVQGS